MICSPCSAQSQTETADEPAVGLEDIVVTASSRSEASQKIPIAIDALGADAIAERQIIDVQALGADQPSLVVTESPFQTSVAIRGVGSTGGNRLYEQSVPFFIDKVFTGRAVQFSQPFFDLERVEIIKGPQSIFVGKNASAGAVSLTSARPTSHLAIGVSGGIEVENNGYLADAFISGPLSEAIKLRLAGHLSRTGPYIENLASGRKEPDDRTGAVRLSVEVDAAEGFSLNAKVEHFYRDIEGRREQLYCANPAITEVADPFGNRVECIEDLRNSTGALTGPYQSIDRPDSYLKDTNGTTAVIGAEIEAGGGVIELTGTWTTAKLNSRSEPDFSALSLGGNDTLEKFTQFSQELRYLSDDTASLRFVFGGLFLKNAHDVLTVLRQPVPNPALIGLLGGSAAAPFVADYTEVNQDSEVWSGFGQVSADLTEQLKLAVGARFTHEKKNYRASAFRYFGVAALSFRLGSFGSVAPARAGSYVLDLEENTFDPSVTLTWQPHKATLLYITAARGSKGGGFTDFPRSLVVFPLPSTALDYSKERAESLEVGAKVDISSQLRVNTSLFYVWYTGLQAQLFNPAALGFETFNVNRSRAYGLEVATTYRPVQSLTLGGAASYLRTKISEFQNPFSGASLAGNELPFAPSWSGNAWGELDIPVGQNSSVTLRAQANFTGRIFFDVLNDLRDDQPGYATVDLRASFSPLKQLELFVNTENLFNKQNIRLFANTSAVTNLLPVADPRLSSLRSGRTVMLGARFRM